MSVQAGKNTLILVESAKIDCPCVHGVDPFLVIGAGNVSSYLFVRLTFALVESNSLSQVMEL